MIKAIRLTAIVATLATTGSVASAAFFDSINPNAAPPFVVYGGPIDIGWYYTPTVSYSLTGISTLFEAVPNGSGARTITVQIQTDRPVKGGTVLDQGTFAANSASGGLLGATFASPVTLTAGRTYFVDFLNTVGMGVNLGQWANDSNGRPMPSAGATTNLGAWYGNANVGDTGFALEVLGPAYYTTNTGNVSFAEPILFFSGNPISVPEPSSAVLAGLGGAGLLAFARGRRRHRVA